MFSKFCHYILLLGILYSGIILGGAAPVYAENRALLVGIDDYRTINPDLRFCESDAKRMRDGIIKYAGFKEENIKMVLGHEATKKGIKRAIKEWLIDKAKPGDKVFFYFSGHGVQIKDPTGQEEDGKDELLCAYDSARHSYTFIRDNELGAWMDQINTDAKIVVLDCCHSGTGTRALIGFGEESDNVPRVRAYYPGPGGEISESTIDEIKEYNPEITEAEMAEALGGGTRGLDTGGETSISGCRDDQVSLESPAVKGGVLTNYIIESMRSSSQTDTNGDGVVTVYELWTAARNRIKTKGWNQEPQLGNKSGGENVAIIGDIAGNAAQPDQNQSAIDYHGKVSRVLGDSVQLSIGSDDGVTRGSIYGVYDASDESKAELRISAVESATSYAEPLEGGGAVQAGDSVIEERHFMESEDLLLLVKPIKAKDSNAKGIAAQLTKKITEKVQQLPHVRLVGAKEAPDRILAGTATSVGGRFEVSLRFINVNIGSSTEERKIKFQRDINGAVRTFFADKTIYKDGESKKVEGFASLIRGSYVLKALANLENPKQGFKINVTLDKGDLAAVDIGDTVEISMRPERDCYVYVLNIGTSGRTYLLFPSKFEPNNFVRAGQKYTIPSTDEYAIEQGGPPGQERVKVIATTQKIPLDRINPEDMDSPIKTFVDGAADLLDESLKDLRLKRRNEWATETVMYTVDDPLFSIGLNFQGALNQRKISSQLRQKFQQKRINLSQDVQDVEILVLKKNRQWTVVDKDEGNEQMYSIRKKDNQLNVYQSLFYSTRDPLELGALE